MLHRENLEHISTSKHRLHLQELRLKLSSQVRVSFRLSMITALHCNFSIMNTQGTFLKCLFSKGFQYIFETISCSDLSLWHHSRDRGQIAWNSEEES